MRDQRNPRSPKARVLSEARNLLARRERLLRTRLQAAIDGGDVHPDLLERPPAPHYAHHPAACVLAVSAFALGLLAFEPPRRQNARRGRSLTDPPAASNASQISSRSASNHALANALQVSASSMASLTPSSSAISTSAGCRRELSNHHKTVARGRYVEGQKIAMGGKAPAPDAAASLRSGHVKRDFLVL